MWFDYQEFNPAFVDAISSELYRTFGSFINYEDAVQHIRMMCGY